MAWCLVKHRNNLLQNSHTAIRHVLMLCVIATIFSAFSLNSIRIKYFRLDPNHSWTPPSHNWCSFQPQLHQCDSSVVPDTLVDVVLYIDTYYSQHRQHSFHLFVNYLLDHTVVALLNCQFFCKFHNLSYPLTTAVESQIIYSLIHSISGVAMLNMSQ
jgi:hypothetical protein